MAHRTVNSGVRTLGTWLPRSVKNIRKGDQEEYLTGEKNVDLSTHKSPRQRTTLYIILAAGFDCFLALLATLFFLLSAYAKHSNGRLVEDVSHSEALLSATQLVGIVILVSLAQYLQSLRAQLSSQ